MINPSSLYEPEFIRKKNTRKGTENNKFYKVTEEAFSFYIKFLKTRNINYLRYAENTLQ